MPNIHLKGGKTLTNSIISLSEIFKKKYLQTDITLLNMGGIRNPWLSRFLTTSLADLKSFINRPVRSRFKSCRRWSLRGYLLKRLVPIVTRRRHTPLLDRVMKRVRIRTWAWLTDPFT